MKDLNEPSTPGPGKAARPLTGRSVLIMLICFFGTIFAVNIYFLVSALSTHTGVVAQEPYRKGLAYNDRIAAGERQNEMGWDVAVDVAPGGRAKLTFTGLDKKPVTALNVTATIGRPATEREDRKLRFAETQPGQYEADGGTLGAGHWVIAAVATRAESSGEPLYRLRKRLWLTP